MSDSNDHELFMRLWIRHQARIYSYIRSMVFRRADAEDILQEVALVLWRKFEQFEPGSRFDQWAYRVAHNQVLYYRQKTNRRVVLFSQDLIDNIADRLAVANASRDGYFDALESCLDGLPTAERDLVRKRYEPGATNRSLAKTLGRSESTISRALNRIYLALLGCIRGKMAAKPAMGGDG